MSFKIAVNFLLLIPLSQFKITLADSENLILPEQVHITLADRPDSILVQWVTLQPVASDSFVEYGKDPNKLNLKQPASVDLFVFNNVKRYMFTAEMIKLDYNYRVGSQNAMSKVFQFKTFPDAIDFPFKVLVFGDLGLQNGVSAPYLLESAQKREFDLAILVGDISYDLHAQDGHVGDVFMRQMEPFFAQIPLLVIAGNHEDDGKNFSNYRYRFNMPQDPFGDSQVYSFDLGPIHWLGISTEYYGYFYEYGQESVHNQYRWLKEDLKAAHANRLKRPWIVSFQHRPFYCSNSNSYECESFENTLVRVGFEDMPGLEDLFVEYGMDLGFWGHEHSCESFHCEFLFNERFFPISRRYVYNLTEKPYENALAPTYIITGSAGCHTPDAEFDEQHPVPGSVKRSTDYGYTMLHVKNRTHLYIEQISVVTAQPKVIDSLWLTKTQWHAPTADKALKELAFAFPPYESSQYCNMNDPRCRHKREVRMRKKRESVKQK
ncbi:Purple acid phosphatase [Aphelenchoides bicaudatus]|nr:Purple acid phosphatase [Aphelenchoides bicaudatus]